MWSFNKIYKNGLVPFCDLLNHSSNYNTNWSFNSINNKFELKSNQFIKKNNELLDTYGTFKSNTMLMLHYGFTLNNNFNDDYIPILHNKIIIKLSLSTISFIDNKKKLQKKCENLLKKLIIKKNIDNNIKNLKKSNIYILRYVINYIKKMII